MRFTILASGSKANAAVIEHEGYRILIDCGLSLRELTKRLTVCGLTPQDLDALLITHCHSDHIAGIPSLLHRVNLDSFSRHSERSFTTHPRWSSLDPSCEVEIGSFLVTPVSLPHDDGGSLGFVLQAGSVRLVFATDFGEPTAELAAALQDADAAVIEANHDLAMLEHCAYPYFLKQRIRSNFGHLSNCQSAKLLNKALSQKCQHLVLAHLSEHANHPSQALKTVSEAVSTIVTAAPQYEPSYWYEVIKGEEARQNSNGMGSRV